VGQILDVKPILVFDHIPQDKTKGIFLHHLVKSSLMKREKIGREEEAIRRILSEELYPLILSIASTEEESSKEMVLIDSISLERC